MSRLRTQVRYAWRRLSARSRVLPDFIIAGAQKSGTTTLFSMLMQHPDVHRPFVPAWPYFKEIHFFDKHYRRGLDWYRAHFLRQSQVGEGQRCGEASPNYLLHPHAAARMANDLPDCRIIVLLRDPVERAISHYHHERRMGTETLELDDALNAEAERTDEDFTRLLDNPDFPSTRLENCSYKRRGRYLEQLERFWMHFPRSQVLVMPAERLFRDPHGVVRHVGDFLGVTFAGREIDATPRNVGSYAREIDATVIASLRDYFRPLNDSLFDALGERYDWP